MRTPRARLLALGLGAVLAGLALPPVALYYAPNPVAAFLLLGQKQTWPSVQTRLDARAPARDHRILAEIEALGTHPWAGVYRTPGMWGARLGLAPRGGFTVYRSTMCGNCSDFRGLGRIARASDSRLELAVELQRDDTSLRVDETLHLIPWGELLFAVPSRKMESFCAQVACGLGLPGLPYRTDEPYDDPPRPSGLPRVPSGYAALIPVEPVECHLAALEEWRRGTRIGRGFWQAVYALDASSDEGLVVGMRLFVSGEERLAARSGRIEKVEGRRATLALDTLHEERDVAAQLVGRRASTLHPEAQRP